MSNLLSKLNEFTRREHTEDEVYIFDLILCDNDIDRDYECFSINALNTLQKLFIGKTGIFDHNPKGSNQTARIFSTEVITDSSRKTAYGANYSYLKACAYMVRTSANKDLIMEIDAGIKKEVSISCNCQVHKCSICGADKQKKSCNHIKGKKYGKTICYTILDDVTDAYEWSFVAVPSQINAGVTKHYNKFYYNQENSSTLHQELIQKDELLNLAQENIKSDITKLIFLTKENNLSTILSTAVEKMNLSEMIHFKNLLQKDLKSKSIPQLLNKNPDNSTSNFKL